jgi:DNA damage-inducible protein 1
MLKAHQACIDLEKNVLRIQGREVMFLAEHELPAKARDSVLLADSHDLTLGNSQPKLASPSGSRQNMPNVPRATVLRRPTPSQARESTAPRWAEKDIETLMEFGVAREVAIQMLDATNGNVDAAASIMWS